jgi:hypothetical protein
MDDNNFRSVLGRVVDLSLKRARQISGAQSCGGIGPPRGCPANQRTPQSSKFLSNWNLYVSAGPKSQSQEKFGELPVPYRQCFELLEALTIPYFRAKEELEGLPVGDFRRFRKFGAPTGPYFHANQELE